MTPSANSPYSRAVPATIPDFDLYAELGLDQSASAEAIETAYRTLIKQHHPDRAGQTGVERSKRLNVAHAWLRDPVRRAEYVLTEEGFPIGEQRSKDVPPELLEEVFDLNMMLEELKTGDSEVRPQLESARQNFVGMRDRSRERERRSRTASP